MLRTHIGRLRAIGIIEGISFLILLGIAMPLKYVWDYPFAVKVAGWTHGILFMGFCAALLHARETVGWETKRASRILLAALLPFGPFVIDGSLRREDEALKEG